MSRLVFLVRSLLFLGACVLAGCGQTNYSAPVTATQSANWRLAEVAVAVPATLLVSEERSLFPRADIVWREDPPGDRHAQVAAIMEKAVRQGASGLSGVRPVRLDLTVTRFHALTFEAEQRLSVSGVHNIDFTIEVADAETGEILAGPETIEAALPALSGARMLEARARGETQKSQITAHIRDVVAGWLGIGPDPRGRVMRLGG